MDFFIWGQLVFNIVAMLTVAALWWMRRSDPEELWEERLTGMSTAMETRMKELEREGGAFRERASQVLSSLERICDDARLLLERGRANTVFPPSREEEELQSLSRDTSPTEPLRRSTATSPARPAEGAGGIGLRALLGEQIQ